MTFLGMIPIAEKRHKEMVTIEEQKRKNKLCVTFANRIPYTISNGDSIKWTTLVHPCQGYAIHNLFYIGQWLIID